MEPFYYTNLSKYQQGIYQTLLQGISTLSSEFLIPRMEMSALSDLFFQLRLDHPEIFWAIGFRCRFFPDSPQLIFIPEYLFEKNKIKKHKRALNARWEKLARPIRHLPDEENEKYIHDFLCENVRYDKLKKPYSHEIIGPLGQGVGVCEGIAKSVKVLCDALGLWCMIALCDNNPQKGIRYRHTWNIIRLNGKYYHLDVTFDNSLSHQSEAGKPIEIRYDYFNRSDASIFRDHEPLIAPAPVCQDEDQFYYRTKKLSFTKMEDVAKRSLQAAKKGATLTFHWRGGYLTREVLEEILFVLKHSGEEKQKIPRIHLNWPQAVLRVEYLSPELSPQPTVTWDEANEGENQSQE